MKPPSIPLLVQASRFEPTAAAQTIETGQRHSAQREVHRPEPDDQALADVSDLQDVRGRHRGGKALAGNLKSAKTGLETISTREGQT